MRQLSWRRWAIGPGSYGDLDQLIDAIVREARPGDHLLVMSNGGFGGIHGKLLARLAADSAGRDASLRA